MPHDALAKEEGGASERGTGHVSAVVRPAGYEWDTRDVLPDRKARLEDVASLLHGILHRDEGKYPLDHDCPSAVATNRGDWARDRPSQYREGSRLLSPVSRAGIQVSVPWGHRAEEDAPGQGEREEAKGRAFEDSRSRGGLGDEKALRRARDALLRAITPSWETRKSSPVAESARKDLRGDTRTARPIYASGAITSTYGLTGPKLDAKGGNLTKVKRYQTSSSVYNGHFESGVVKTSWWEPVLNS